MRAILSLLLLLSATVATAQTARRDTIDISADNTSSNYVSYTSSLSLPATRTVDVLMARYCYFSSTISGKGTLNLHAGGERCYLGTAKGAAWPNWTGFSGEVHVFPYSKNSSSAGFYGVVLAHGGKSFSAEDVEGGIKGGKVNTSMQNNRLVLHSGATLCCEANTSGAGFRIGELQTEPGSSIIGYMKKNTRAAHFIVGATGTDATLEGLMAPPDYSDTHPLGLIKEGSGTYRITGNDNYLSASLRIMAGRVLVKNNVDEARQQKRRGAVGARPSDSEAIAYVFEQGTLGGTGSVGGTVDNYGTIEPGDDATGTLTIQNFVSPTKSAHLVVRPASVLRFKVESAASHDRLVVGGQVRYNSMAQDFSQSDKMPQVELAIADGATLQVGDELILVSAKGKNVQAADWNFELKKPEHYTWILEERSGSGGYELVARLVSLDDDTTPDDPDNPDTPTTPTMGAYYDDGIDDQADTTPLRTYAEQCGKRIGTALSTWKTDVANDNLAETREAARQFNLLVAENEMKFDALQPSRGQFSFSPADKLVSFAQRHQMAMRGHCLVWHMQQPQWLSSDGKKNDKNWSRQEALQIMQHHIATVMAHFKGKVTEWDVVNECLEDDQTSLRTNPAGYDLRQQSVWQRAIGDDYIDSAFVYAHRADPTALLYLNDYGVELQGKAKAMAFYNLATRLKQRGIPIDGVGLQCHFSNGDVDSLRLAQTVRRFAEAGLKCIITELDMGTPSTSATNLEEQARNYRVVTDIMLSNDNCPTMVVWGLKDNDSWRSDSNPLLYTAQLARKPAWYAVRSAIRHLTLTAPPLRGDINGDGSVDVGDIMAIINVMAVSPRPVPGGISAGSSADVNNDGHVDVGDIMAVINIMAT